MNKKSSIIVGAIILVIAAAGTYLALNRGTEQKIQPVENPTQPQENVTSETPSPVAEAGKYEAYSEEAMAATASKQRLLFFHASWCPQCRELDASIRESSLPANIVILKVDYDSSQALRQKYGVTLQTTVVKIDAEGNKLKSFVAYNEPTFASVERELLK